MMPPKIVVLTGAGISSESGLKTFRDNNGLWENHRVEEVATPDAFKRNPELVYRFYNLRRQQLLSGEVKPNKAHTELALFEKKFQGEFVLVTQNVDNLHERAGSQNVIHMHGELTKIRCVHSGEVFESLLDIDENSICECCQKKGNLRPHIVWFGEIPLFMDEIQKHLSECQLFISVGTSGNVYPAAGFVEIAKSFAAKTVELNMEKTILNSMFDEGYYGPATEVVEKYFARLL
ncbi:MAG: NAD-dependent protein deacylase [Halobacteriovoraceae bacterium]|nr:NAD-dependent protein deacylase [Halobacteriovoraceae bacterium]